MQIKLHLHRTYAGDVWLSKTREFLCNDGFRQIFHEEADNSQEVLLEVWNRKTRGAKKVILELDSGYDLILFINGYCYRSFFGAFATVLHKLLGRKDGSSYKKRTLYVTCKETKELAL